MTDAPTAIQSDTSRRAGSVPANIEETNVRLRLLLLLPFIGLLAVPLYNREEPSLFGFPFFYWYLLLWVPTTSLLIHIVHRGERTED
jgi:hypothetical protein